MRGYLGIIVSVFLLSVPLALAVQVPASQQNMTIEVPEGSEYSFHLNLQGLTELVTITADGDAKDWITFGPTYDKTIALTNLVNQALPVTIFVPTGTAKQGYGATVKANGQVISTLNVVVTDRLSKSFSNIGSSISGLQSAVSGLQGSQNQTQSQLASVSSGQGSVLQNQGSMQSAVNDLKSSFSSSIDSISQRLDSIVSQQKAVVDEMKSYDAERANLQSKIDSLQSTISSLQSKNAELVTATGNVTQTQSAGILGGVLAGLLIAFLYGRRESISMPKVKLRRNKALGPEKPRAVPAKPRPRQTYQYNYRITKR